MASQQRCFMGWAIRVLLSIASVLVLEIKAFQSTLPQTLRLNHPRQEQQQQQQHAEETQQAERRNRNRIIPLGIRSNDDVCDRVRAGTLADDDHESRSGNARDPDGSISRRAFAASLSANMASATLLFPQLAMANGLEDDEDEDDSEELVFDNDEDDAPVSMVDYLVKDFTVSLPDNWKVLTEFDKDEVGSAKGASYPTLFSAVDVRTGSFLTVVQEEACGLEDLAKSKDPGSPLVCDFVQPKEGAPPLFSTETYTRDATQLLIRHDDREKANSALLGGSSISKLVDTNLVGYGSSYAKGMDSTMTAVTYFETRSAVLDLEATTTTISLDQADPIERRVLAKAVATTTTITRTTEVIDEDVSSTEAAVQSEVPSAPSESSPSPTAKSVGKESDDVGSSGPAAESDAPMPTAQEAPIEGVDATTTDPTTTTTTTTQLPLSTSDTGGEKNAPQTPASDTDATVTVEALQKSSAKVSNEESGTPTDPRAAVTSDIAKTPNAVVASEAATSAPPTPSVESNAIATTSTSFDTAPIPERGNTPVGATMTAMMAMVASIASDSSPTDKSTEISVEMIPSTITKEDPPELDATAFATSESSPASTTARSDATKTTDAENTPANETSGTGSSSASPSSRTEPEPLTTPDAASRDDPGAIVVPNTEDESTPSLSSAKREKELSSEPATPTATTTTTTTSSTIRSTTVVSIWLTAPVDEWERQVMGDRLNEVWESVKYNNVGSKRKKRETSDAPEEDDTLNAQLLLLNRN